MRTTYNTILTQNPCICLRWFAPMIQAASTGAGVRTTQPFSLQGLDYVLQIEAEMMKTYNDTYTLSLQWTDGDDICRQAVYIQGEERGLLNGCKVYYFITPQGDRCKKLFYICGAFRSRRSFFHRYYCQVESRLQRTINNTPEPYRRSGKRVYRGTLTPYGRRCERYEHREDQSEQALIEILTRIHKYINRHK